MLDKTDAVRLVSSMKKHMVSLETCVTEQEKIDDSGVELLHSIKDIASKLERYCLKERWFQQTLRKQVASF